MKLVLAKGRSLRDTFFMSLFEKSKNLVPAKKRWVVERTFAWLENFRRLCRNYEETTESANEMLMVAAVVISLRKLTSVNNRF